MKQYCTIDDPNEFIEPPAGDECADLPPATECPAGTKDGAKTSMTCKIPKCIIDDLKRWDWPGIGFGPPPPLPASKSAATSMVQLGKGDAAGQCVCVGPVNQQGKNAGHESVDSPEW